MRGFCAPAVEKVFAMNRLALCVAVIAASAFAAPKAVPTAPTHHCVKDGATVEKTKKECKKEGGTWEKLTAPAPAPAKPAPTK